MSKLDNKVNRLSGSILSFVNTLINKIKYGRASALQVNEAETLNDVELVEHIATVSTAYDAHVDDRNNPHGITLADLNAPSKAQVDAEVGQRLSALGSVIARYGRSNFLDPNIQGGFESGSGNVDHRDTVLNLEKDGTLVMLRNATDGANIGCYYSYCPNATGTELQPMVHTGIKYRPGFIPANRDVAYVYRSGKGCVVGRLKDNTTGREVDEYFLALTNGTLDAATHVGFQLSDNFAGQKLLSTFLPTCEFLRIDDEIVVISVQQFSTPVKLHYYRTSIVGKSMDWNAPLEFSRYMGTMTYRGPYGDKTSTDASIQLAARVSSSNLADEPLIHTQGDIASTTLLNNNNGSAITVSRYKNGKIRTRIIAIASYMYATAGGERNERRSVELSVVYDLTTATITTDDLSNLPLTTSANNGTIAFSVNLKTRIDLTGSSLGIFTYSVTAGRGYWFTFRKYYQPDSHWYFGRRKFMSGMDEYTLLNAALSSTGEYSEVSSLPMYGSAVTSRLRPIAVIPNGIISSQLNPELNVDELVFTQVDFTSQTTHPSVSYVSDLRGYAINTNRVKLPREFEMIVSHIKSDQSVAAYGGRFFSTSYTERNLKVMSDAQWSPETVSFSPTMHNSLLADVATLIPNGETYVDKWMDVIIPPDNDIPCFGIIFERKNDQRTHRSFCFIFDTPQRSGAVTQWSNIQIGAGFANVGDGALANPINYSESTLALNPTFIIETPTHYNVDMHSIFRYLFGNSSRMDCYQFQINKVTKTLDQSAHYVGSTLTSGHEYNFALPYKGYGAMLGFIDSGTKAAFSPALSSTFIPYPGRSADSTDYFVTVTQRLAEGFTVYFVDEVPIVMGGRKGIIAPTSLDLRSIDPAPFNKTFRVYVGWVDGENPGFYYTQITTQYLPDTDDLMFVGTITTDTQKITSINIGNVTRLGKYRLSTEPAHSAIPVSSGLPMLPSKLNWS